MDSIGPYLAGSAFWIFIATVAIVAIITDYKRRRSHVDVLRAAIDKGQQLDPAVIEKLKILGIDGYFVKSNQDPLVVVNAVKSLLPGGMSADRAAI